MGEDGALKRVMKLNRSVRELGVATRPSNFLYISKREKLGYLHIIFKHKQKNKEDICTIFPHVKHGILCLEIEVDEKYKEISKTNTKT